MKKIFKYSIKDAIKKDPIEKSFILELPRGVQILSVAGQQGSSYIWALVDPETTEMEYIKFWIFQANDEIYDYFFNGIQNVEFLGTVVFDSKVSTVWHFFYEKKGS